MEEMTRKTFYKPVDKRSRAAMTAFLANHFRYDTANGRNFTSVSETGTRCGRCGEQTRVDFKQPPLEVFAYPMRDVDGGEGFEDWSLWDLQQRTALVQEFDRLADDIVTAGIEMAEKFEVREEIFFKPVRKKCFA